MTTKELELMQERLEMAAEVTIPADKAKELLRLALIGKSVEGDDEWEC